MTSRHEQIRKTATMALNTFSPGLFLFFPGRNASSILFVMMITSLPQAGRANLIRRFIRQADKNQGNHRLENADCGTVAVIGVDQAAPIYIGGNDIRRGIGGAGIKQENLLIAHVQHPAHGQQELNGNNGGNAGNADMQHLFPPGSAVNGGCLIEILIHSGQGRKVNDGTPARLLPDFRDDINRPEPLRK